MFRQVSEICSFFGVGDAKVSNELCYVIVTLWYFFSNSVNGFKVIQKKIVVLYYLASIPDVSRLHVSYGICAPQRKNAGCVRFQVFNVLR